MWILFSYSKMMNTNLFGNDLITLLILIGSNSSLSSLLVSFLLVIVLTRTEMSYFDAHMCWWSLSHPLHSWGNNASELTNSFFSHCFCILALFNIIIILIMDDIFNMLLIWGCIILRPAKIFFICPDMLNHRREKVYFLFHMTAWAWLLF